MRWIHFNYIPGRSRKPYSLRCCCSRLLTLWLRSSRNTTSCIHLSVHCLDAATLCYPRSYGDLKPRVLLSPLSCCTNCSLSSPKLQTCHLHALRPQALPVLATSTLAENGHRPNTRTCQRTLKLLSSPIGRNPGCLLSTARGFMD